MADASRDGNFVTTLLGVSNADGTTPVKVYADPVTHRLLVDSAGAGTGTVTDVSVVSANGFAGTVANSTTTPAITLSTTITGILKGNGTAMSAATAGTDYTALAFKTISVSGQSDVVADSAADTLTLVSGTGITITTNAGTDSITFAASGTASDITVGATTVTGGTDTKVLFDNAGVLGEYTVSGSGNVAMTTNPVFTTPTLGVASATTINKVTITAPATGSTLTIANGKTLTVSNSGTLSGGDAFVLSIAAAKTLTVSNTLTFTGTDSSSVNFGGGGTVLYTTSAIPLTVGTTTIASGTNTRILYDNSGVLGEYTVTGSGTTAVLSTAPTFTTSIQTPLVIGGSGTTGTQLTLKTTTGNGTTDQMVFLGGNNGGTTFATLKANSLDLGTSAALTTGTIELGAASDTTLSRSSAGVLAVEGVVIPSISSTNTLTNKRITRRLTTTNAPGATPTTNTDNVDVMNFTGLNTAITSMTTSLSGTPSDGDLIEFRFTDDGTARAITWGASFAATTVALPTTTVISTMLRVGFEWNGSVWQCVATC